MLHLIKNAPGCESLDQLISRQRPWIVTHTGGGSIYRHRTRYLPKRIEEIVNAGSMFWIIKRQILARQAILGFENVRIEAQEHVLLHLNPEPVPVLPTPRRPHQGWRYLEMADAPPDAASLGPAGEGLPPALARELRELALI
jgi:hypothetical protein